MKIDNINYLTEDPAPQYAADLHWCLSAKELFEKLEADWSELASDAIEIVKGMSDEDFVVFRAGLKKERKGEFAGEKYTEKYSSVLMPEIMFKASMMAIQYKAPWGLAFIRLQEHEKVKPA